GNYSVQLALAGGETQTLPADNAAYPVTLARGDQLSGKDFGIQFGTGTISGHVFTDTNGNGQFDPGEPDLPGVTISLDGGADGTTDLTTQTNSSGDYTFPDLPS